MATTQTSAGARRTRPAPDLVEKYWKVAIILTIITAVEVAIFYIPPVHVLVFVPPHAASLSALKFAIVAMFYMHLKYDHKPFRSLFTGPLMIAILTLIGLLFLFSKLAIKIGILA